MLCVCASVCVCMGTCVYAHMCAYVYACVCAYVYACVCVRARVCMCATERERQRERKASRQTDRQREASRSGSLSSGCVQPVATTPDSDWLKSFFQTRPRRTDLDPVWGPTLCVCQLCAKLWCKAPSGERSTGFRIFRVSTACHFDHRRLLSFCQAHCQSLAEWIGVTFIVIISISRAEIYMCVCMCVCICVCVCVCVCVCEVAVYFILSYVLLSLAVAGVSLLKRTIHYSACVRLCHVYFALYDCIYLAAAGYCDCEIRGLLSSLTRRSRRGLFPLFCVYSSSSDSFISQLSINYCPLLQITQW